MYTVEAESHLLSHGGFKDWLYLRDTVSVLGLRDKHELTTWGFDPRNKAHTAVRSVTAGSIIHNTTAFLMPVYTAHLDRRSRDARGRQIAWRPKLTDRR